MSERRRPWFASAFVVLAGSRLASTLVVLAVSARSASAQCAEFAPIFADNGPDSTVQSLAVHDDGTGPALYAGGWYSNAGGAPASNVAKWDGAAWTPLGSGLQGFGTYALCSFDDGTGPALYAGGNIYDAGGVSVSNLARWDGTSWSDVGGGVNGFVYALCAYDDGSGPALYVGGTFTQAGGMPASAIAKWDGASWSTLASGMQGGGPRFSPQVKSIVVFDDGVSTALYVGGQFIGAGGIPARCIARWDDAGWSSLGTIDQIVNALAVHDDGEGPALYAAGAFTNIDGHSILRVARYRVSSGTWTGLGTGLGFPAAAALVSFDEGTRNDLYAGGTFSTAGGQPASYVARWDGSSWSELGGGANSAINCFAKWDDAPGGGADLYLGGYFTAAGGVSASHVAKWKACRSRRDLGRLRQL